VAGSNEGSAKKIGLGAITSPEIQSLLIQAREGGTMVQGKSEKELDFPWHLRASKTKTQRSFVSFFEAFTQLLQSLSSCSPPKAFFDSQQALVVLQQLDFEAEVAVTNVGFKGLLRMA
jgi:hypothetical protein